MRIIRSDWEYRFWPFTVGGTVLLCTVGAAGMWAITVGLQAVALAIAVATGCLLDGC